MVFCGDNMIDIKLSGDNGETILSCGAGLSEEEEKETYFALRNALIERSKLIKVFGDKI